VLKGYKMDTKWTKLDKMKNNYKNEINQKKQEQWRVKNYIKIREINRT